MTKDDFAARVQAMQGTLYRVACAYLNADCDRGDAVQEAILKAWQALSSLREEAYFETWLTRILIRECANIQRRQKRVLPVAAVPDRPSPPEDTQDDLKTALLKLPERMRIPVVLFYMEGYDVEEIARVMRIPKGTVCSRLARAREQLKEAME